ncbi:polysaccharide deacetylase [Natronococcus pandeyae]|uniref:Polysaccharide deacetylase n=1 Tax=Natronococcus pandeyae TaxID=2055836 RepID=A0A8J8TSK7_9EURY|nr:polysaccharide deacetylase family protein [Natronococcus pandeyae]TYL38874.1 polysaccharide deacetylase [Natronococcus pandeyae]
MDRRTYLATGVAIALGGCTELGGPGESDTNDEHSSDSDESTGGTASDSDDADDSDEDDYPELVGTFDDFEDLDEWWTWQDIGSLQADASRSYDGSQSALLTSSTESDGQVRIRRELDEPIDVRDVAPGIATATDTDQGVVRIQLQDEDAHYVEYSQQIQGDMPLTRTNFGITRVRGEPDLSKVVVLQIIRWFGDDAEGQQWVDDFHFVPNIDPGKVMLQFHGGYETHYTEALSRLEEYDFPATAFVPTGRLRSDPAVEGDRLTRDQLDELAAANWTIGAQPATGMPLGNVDSDRLEDVIVDPIDWLSGEGYEDGARFFAFPASRYTEESYELVKEHYDLAFAGRSRSQGYAGNPHLCSRATASSPEEATELLDWTVEWGGITTIAFHQLDDPTALEALDETLASLEEHASAGDLEVITPAEMADEYVY